ncbi:MAG: DUF695 domain-containing protein [Sphingobacteriales bacterium]|nr:DUF695 domain-containing protein [Sphingobacteriales bacterium]
MKRILFFFVLTLFIQSLFAQSGEWDTYIARYEKGPGSTLVNMSLKNNAPDTQYPYLFAAGVQFKNCTAEGLPAPLAFNSLTKISDSVVALLARLNKPVLAGTFTYQCERKDYFYVTDTTGLREAVAKLLARQFPGYTPAFLVKEDRPWDAYLRFLYPNETTREYMSNQKVVMQLQKAGDKLDQPRPVEHWLYFKTETDRECFIYTAVSKKFKVESKETITTHSFPYKVRVSRTDRVDLRSINTLTGWLKEEAGKCKGEYDGWETVVIK